MNFPSAPKAAATALAATLFTLPASASRPPRLTPEEKTALAADAASVAPQQKKAAAETKGLVEADIQTSKEANQAVAAFLKQAAISAISIEAATAPTPPSRPLEVTRTPLDTVIESDDGMYFDFEKGLLVYLKNVRLNDPRFTLSGANELKIILAKKPVEGAKEAKPTSALAGDTPEFGDVERIIATGAVKLVQKPVPGKESIEASAAVVTYNVKTGEIILNGGYPWVKQGDKVFRAMQPDLYLRIQKDFSFVTEGNWDTSGRLDKKESAAKPLLGDPKDWERYNTAGLRNTNFSFTPDPKLPNMLVLGDSLSIGYTLPLRENLRGALNTFRPIDSQGRPVNCETSTNGRKNLAGWLGDKKWSVISFNFGLWDTELAKTGQPSVPLETYKANLQAIVTRLKETGARLIWVSTTTPQPADGKHAAMVTSYNAAAKEIMERNQVEICDLHATSLTIDKSLKEGPLHLSGPGSRILASKLFEVVKSK